MPSLLDHGLNRLLVALGPVGFGALALPRPGQEWLARRTGSRPLAKALSDPIPFPISLTVAHE